MLQHSPRTSQVGRFSPPRRRTYNHSQLNTGSSSISFSYMMPTQDVIAHLVRVADFHLNSLLRYFEPTEVLSRLDLGAIHNPATHANVWQARLLAIMALGKLYIEKGAPIGQPPGFYEFHQADLALPSPLQLVHSPVAAVETLCLLSHYAQAADLHEMAVIYVSPQRLADLLELVHNTNAFLTSLCLLRLDKHQNSHRHRPLQLPVLHRRTERTTSVEALCGCRKPCVY